MFQFLYLQWGRISRTLNISGRGTVFSGEVKPLEGEGVVTTQKGSGSTKGLKGSGGSTGVKGSGGVG